MTATAVPTLSELLSWDTEHLTEGADYWEHTADRWDSAFAEAEQQIRASGWEGEAFGAATERAYADKVRVGNVADDLREGASAARQGASEISAARSRLQYLVEDAQDAGFDVYDDYTVASRQTVGTAAEQAALQAQAESFADESTGAPPNSSHAINRSAPVSPPPSGTSVTSPSTSTDPAGRYPRIRAATPSGIGGPTKISTHTTRRQPT